MSEDKKMDTSQPHATKSESSVELPENIMILLENLMQSYNRMSPTRPSVSTPGSSNMGVQRDNATILYLSRGSRPFIVGLVDGKKAYASIEFIEYPSSSGDVSSSSSSGTSNISNFVHPTGPFTCRIPALPYSANQAARGTGFLLPLTLHYHPVNHQARVGTSSHNYGPWPRGNSGTSERTTAMNELPRGPRDTTTTISPDSLDELFEGVSYYNSKEFETVYDRAKFYVIKSFTEDHIHKSMEHCVWSSTQTGNEKLDAAFREADAITKETGKHCPVFLFFSVNGSKHFMGVAEMKGGVDYSKNMDFWQQNRKWIGFFPVEWHIVKDIPFNQLQNITIERENQKLPVLYSRDAQEIKLEQGLEMLKIFKNYVQSDCLLDRKCRREREAADSQIRQQDEQNPEAADSPEADENTQSDPSLLSGQSMYLSLKDFPPLRKR